MAIDTGFLLQTVEIANIATTPNNYGAAAISFATLGSFVCNFQPLSSGSESVDESTIQARQTYRLVVEPTTALNVKDRVLVSSELYNVMSVGILSDIEDGTDHHKEAICEVVI